MQSYNFIFLSLICLFVQIVLKSETLFVIITTTNQTSVYLQLSIDSNIIVFLSISKLILITLVEVVPALFVI
jgi:hypothetical protein